MQVTKLILKNLKKMKQTQVPIITIAKGVANESQKILALVEANKTKQNQNGKIKPRTKNPAMKKSKSRFVRP